MKIVSGSREIENIVFTHKAKLCQNRGYALSQLQQAPSCTFDVPSPVERSHQYTSGLIDTLGAGII